MLPTPQGLVRDPLNPSFQRAPVWSNAPIGHRGPARHERPSCLRKSPAHRARIDTQHQLQVERRERLNQTGDQRRALLDSESGKDVIRRRIHADTGESRAPLLV